jgi:drug/metabolite transporter (DMT)-like permease
MPRAHALALLQALFVTFLWSTSWVLIKIGLAEIPALTFAGLRYALATLVLLPFALRRTHVDTLRLLPRRRLLDLALLGLLLYALTQGAQFVALAELPAATLGLAFSFTPVLVASGAALFLGERLVPRQGVGVALFVAGALLYLGPQSATTLAPLGLAAAVVGLVANAGGSVVGRRVNRGADLPPVLVTTVSMGLGATLLLGAGWTTQGMPAMDPTSWGIVVWLAVVNTAFAFTLWNRTLQRLSALESSVVNTTMLVQIAILAALFLGEALTPVQVLGLLVATLGTLVVQLRLPDRPYRRRPTPGAQPPAGRGR